MKRGQALRALFFHMTMDSRMPRQNLTCSLEFLVDRLETIHNPSFLSANSGACSTFSTFKSNPERMSIERLGFSIWIVCGPLLVMLNSLDEAGTSFNLTILVI